jgi:tyrosyl-tRNA synthetase
MLLLRKLRQFQDLGHEAILIIGDFTAMIGDPSGRSATRPQLTHEQVLANAESYRTQAFKVLDPKRTRIVFNGDWFKKMSFAEVIRLNSRVTLQQMLQREDFKERIEQQEPIRAHEIQYPIMQGWDSVQVQADVELGGTDQLFNILVGRDLQKEEGQPQQVVLLLPILEGLDGVQKMSKSLGNAIGIHEPPQEMYGKVMSISDELMWRFWELLTDASMEEIAAMKQRHPMQVKKELAARIVSDFHSAEAAQKAAESWEAVFQKDESPDDVELIEISYEEIAGSNNDGHSFKLEKLLHRSGLAESVSDGVRKIKQKAVRFGNEVKSDSAVLVDHFPFDVTIRVGRKLKRVLVKK